MSMDGFQRRANATLRLTTAYFFGLSEDSEKIEHFGREFPLLS
jgi:hypothetical protein